MKKNEKRTKMIKLIATFAPLMLGAAVLVSQKAQATNYQIILSDDQGREIEPKKTLDLADDPDDFTLENQYALLLYHFQLSADELDCVERNTADKKIVIKLKKKIKTRINGFVLDGQINWGFGQEPLGLNIKFMTLLRKPSNRAKVERCFNVNLDDEENINGVNENATSNAFQYRSAGGDTIIKYGDAHELNCSSLTPEQSQAVQDLTAGRAVDVDLTKLSLDHSEFDRLIRFAELGLTPETLKMTYIFYQYNGKLCYRPVFSMKKMSGALSFDNYFKATHSFSDQKEVMQNVLNALIELHKQGIAYGGNIINNILVNPQTKQISFVGLRHAKYRKFNGEEALNSDYLKALRVDNNGFLTYFDNLLFQKNYDLHRLAKGYLDNSDKYEDLDEDLLTCFNMEAEKLIDQLGRPILTENDLLGLTPQQQKVKKAVYQVAINRHGLNQNEINFDPKGKCPITGKNYDTLHRLALVSTKDKWGNYYCFVYDYNQARTRFANPNSVDPITHYRIDQHDPKCFFAEVDW